MRHAQSKASRPRVEGLSYLETRSVRPATLVDYQRRLHALTVWLGFNPVLMLNLVILDSLMVDYLEDLFDMGKGIDSGIRAIAALRFFHPLIGRGQVGILTRAARALKGWHAAAPPLQRMPIPLEGWKGTDGPQTFSPVRLLSTTGGERRIEGQTAHSSPAGGSNRGRVPQLGHSASSQRGSPTRQDKRFRCVRDHRLGFVDGATAQNVGAEQGGERSTLARFARGDLQILHDGHISPQSRPHGVEPLQSQTRGSYPRRASKTEVAHGGEAARSLGIGYIGQAVREAGSHAVRVGKDSCSSPAIWCEHHQSATRPPQVSAHASSQQAWNQRITKRMRREKTAKPSFPKRLSGSEILRKLFRSASKPNSRRIFLDLFSGCGKVSAYLVKEGHAGIAVDTCVDHRLDLSDEGVLNVIRGWIQGGCVRGIWLATPCSSWSRARHGPVGSSWGPLRSSYHIWGIPNLSSRDQAKIRHGNATVRATCHIIRCAVQFKVPCFLENPAGSMMWQAPPIKKLCMHRSSQVFITDFCQHHARWRKRTRVQAWFDQDVPQFHLQCHGRAGICSRTQKHHIILKGQDPVSGQLWTQLAQPYPGRFAAAAARALIVSAETQDDFHLRARFCN